MTSARSHLYGFIPKGMTLLLLATSTTPADDRRAQASGDLTDASLETLMNIEVSSPTRKDQKLSQTAGAVYVVTQEDIRRSGAINIPDVLRMVPGLQVAQIDSSSWVVTARGFASRFADKMLVMIDGRSIYNNLYSGVYWDQSLVPLDDIERIEVIRGPGATMWGANAVNGVINIITKPAQETQGFTVTATGGSQAYGYGAARYGGTIGENLSYRLYTQSFAEGPLDNRGQEMNDGWSSTQGGGRLDWKLSDRDSLTVSGDMYSGTAHQFIYTNYPANSLLPPMPDTVGTAGGYALARWSRRYSATSDIALQLSLSSDDRREAFGAVNARIFDLDFQHRYAVSPRHDILWGLDVRVYDDRLESRRMPGPGGDFIQFIPAHTVQPLASAFIEDAVALAPDRLTLTVGTQIEHNVYTGFEIQPSVRLAWTPTAQQTFWSAASRAVRTPSLSDRDLLLEFQPLPQPGVVGVLRGATEFESENNLSYEAGYRNQPARWLTLDLATFFSTYSDLRTLEVGAPSLEPGPPPQLLMPFTWGNNAAGHTYGVELASHWVIAPRWRLEANYSWFRYGLNAAHLGPGSIAQDVEGTSPAHQVQFRSQFDISRKFSFDTGVYYVSALPAIGVPGYVRTDGRLGWRVTPALEISLTGQNLLNGQHLEFVPQDYLMGSQPERTAYLKLTWKF